MINLNKKKKIVLLILAIPFTRSLIHYFFYPERIMRGPTFEEKLDNIFNAGKKWTGEYYSFGDHLGFSFSKNHELFSVFLYENFDILYLNGLWLYLPATLLVLFLFWIFDGKN